ncbi:MAG TPA: hypothetical protein VFF13_01075 [archaeon]|nr:hypothetical protein [archaeon]
MNFTEFLKPTKGKIIIAVILFVVLSVGSLLIDKSINSNGHCNDVGCYNIGFPLTFGEEQIGCGGPVCLQGAEMSTEYHFGGDWISIVVDLIFAYLLSIIIIKFGVKK